MDVRRRNELVLAAVGALLAAGSALALRGFTVDDAFIPARYAAHVASGAGYRFNVGGAATDGVTPLPFVPLLVVASGFGGVHRAWMAARVLGFAAWVLTGGLLGREVARVQGSPARLVALLPLALSAPLSGWSTAGLETPLAALLVTLAAIAELPFQGALAAGLAAAFRPELLPMALVLGVWRGSRTGRSGLASFLAIGPWLLVAGIRGLVFGRGFPLAVLAKPSDTTHGLLYVARAILLTGAPLLALAPFRLFRGADLARARWLSLAFLAHALAVTMAGGDWMPWFRLFVPALPLLVVAAIDLGAVCAPAWTLVRGAMATTAMVYTWRLIAADAVTVVDTRAALIRDGAPRFAGRRAIAALDIGWVGAATDGTIVDLAGLTDSGIAQLPGGHTSKAVSSRQLSARGVDTLVLLRQRGCTGACVRDDGGPYDRAVEERLATDPWVQGGFARAGELTSGDLVYVLWTRR